MIDIRFEDTYILAVYKPNNMLVHHSAMANNQLEELSLVQLLKQELGIKYYPVHRLDRKTSGIILFAKQKEFVKPFQDLFVNNQIQKTYYGLVRGFIPENGKIDSPVKGRDANVHKEALTYYKRIKIFSIPIQVGPYKVSRYSLVALQPKTGRLHQLRIHMNKISHPLIGDPKYGDRFHNRMFLEKFNIDSLFLHAKTLEFIHPFTQKTHTLTADMPKKWEFICTELEKIQI
ncbi:tRNA pseudouridine65 synthase [Wenyingzhuangia heitensis]|uniref:tRNA pseudouridine65 synthase n=1 Tax=Wenyingzhuangia heitensis TaxID=1487859 RepID=A0ABX0U8K1_9FLAO|nr:pseudouridine synthase [Wenyingzhuangia heitensis]NIJ45172.1 tRNA pseudouridine65 synthase [Wenyingzhuangia heitensis]